MSLISELIEDDFNDKREESNDNESLISIIIKDGFKLGGDNID